MVAPREVAFQPTVAQHADVGTGSIISTRQVDGHLRLLNHARGQAVVIVQFRGETPVE